VLASRLEIGGDTNKLSNTAGNVRRCPVSVEAISWALNLALVAADRGGQLSSTCKFAFVGLAALVWRVRPGQPDARLRR
jgi:hypothetical protein